MWTHVVAIVLQTINGTSCAKKTRKHVKLQKHALFPFKTSNTTCGLVWHPMVHTCANFQPICSKCDIGLPVSTTFGYHAIHLVPRILVIVNTCVNHLQKPMFGILYGI